MKEKKTTLAFPELIEQTATAQELLNTLEKIKVIWEALPNADEVGDWQRLPWA